MTPQEIQAFSGLLDSLKSTVAMQSARQDDDDDYGFKPSRWARAFREDAAIRLGDTGKLRPVGRCPHCGERQDTATAMFEHQLLHIMAQTYDRQYPGLQAMQWMQMASGIPVGAESVAMVGYDVEGHATILAGEGNDIRRVTVDAQAETTRIVGLAVKWAVTWQQLQAAAMAQVPLSDKGMAAARLILDTEVDSLLANGNATFGLVGICGQVTRAFGAVGAGVDLMSVGVPAAFVATWDTVATAANIQNDFAIMMGRYRANSIWMPDTCLMGTNTFSRLENMPAAAGTDRTVLQLLRSLYPGITFAPWFRLNAAGAGGGERVMLYANDRNVCEGIAPLAPTNLPQSWDGYQYQTVMLARCGGIQAADTTGMLYADM